MAAETLHDWWSARSPADAAATTRLVRSRARARSIRIAVTLPLTMGLLTALGKPQAAFLAAFALISILVTGDFSGPRRERFWSILVVTGLGAGALIAGGLLAFAPVLKVVVALLLGVGVTLAAALRGFLSRATVPVLLPYFIATTALAELQMLPQMLLGWLVGGLIAAVAAIMLWPFFPRGQLSEAISDTIDAEACAVAAYWGVTTADPQQARDGIEQAMGRVHEIYLGQQSRAGSAYRRERYLLRLVEEIRRLRVSLRIAYRRLPFEPSSADTRLAGATVAAMAQSSEALRTAHGDLTAFRELDAARDEHRREVIDSVANSFAVGDAEQAKDRGTTSFRPRALSLQALGLARDSFGATSRDALPDVRLRGQTVVGVVTPLRPDRLLRAQLSLRAPWMRNAIRFGLSLALATAVVEVVGLDRGYWVVLGTISVLRLDLSGTNRVAAKVLVGQLAGFALALLMVAVVGEGSLMAWLLLPLLAALQGYVAGNASMPVQQASFTVMLVNLVLVSGAAQGVALLRLQDVLIGVVVALVASALLFPRGLTPQVQDSLLAAVAASAELLRQSVRADPQLPAALRRASAALARAEDTVDLAIAQGVGRGARTELWSRLLGACEYVAYIAGVLVIVGQRDELPRDARRAIGAVAAAGVAAADRWESATAALVHLSDDVQQSEELPGFTGVTEYSASVGHALTSVDSRVDQWAAARVSDNAPAAVELYWSLGWIGEVDLLAANLRAQVSALRSRASQPATVLAN